MKKWNKKKKEKVTETLKHVGHKIIGVFFILISGLEFEISKYSYNMCENFTPFVTYLNLYENKYEYDET